MPESSPSGIPWISQRACLATLVDCSGTECEKQGHGRMFTVVKGLVGMSGLNMVLFSFFSNTLSPFSYMHYTGRNQLFSCVNYSLSREYIFRYLPTAFQFAVIPVHLTRQRAKMKLTIVALTGLVALVASQDATSTSTSLTPQQSCATKCTFCNFRDTSISG
jgi:hypothetical protein